MYDEFVFFVVFVQKNIRNMALLNIEQKMRVRTNPIPNLKYLIFQEPILQSAGASNFVFISITKLTVFLPHIVVQVFLFGGWLSTMQTFKKAHSFHFMDDITKGHRILYEGGRKSYQFLIQNNCNIFTRALEIKVRSF